MPTVIGEVCYQSISRAICRPIQNNKLRFIAYISLALCGALVLSVTFGSKFDASREKFRGEPRKRVAREAVATTSEGFKDPFPERPRIQTRNGHLIIEASQDKNIDFKTSGSRGTITINGHKIDKLLNVTRALEKSSQFGSGSSSFGLGGNDADQYEVVLRNLFASNERFATVEKAVDDLKKQVSKLRSQASKLSKRLTNRLKQLSQVSKQQETLLTKLKRNDCFDSDSGQPVCKNGATCLDTYDGFKCLCPGNFEGPTCELDVDECSKFRGTDLGCQNGARCVNLPGSYRCECTSQYHGVHCTEQHDDCAMSSSLSLCGYGKCLSLARQDANQARYECICDQGWTTDGANPACVIDINECLAGQQSSVASNITSSNIQSASVPWSNSLVAAYPCSQSPFVECTNLPGSFQCGPCPPGYLGNGRVCRPVDLCLQNNGGCSIQPLVECVSIQGTRRCGACPPGYTGDGVICSRISACSADFNGGCHPMAKCKELPSVSPQSRLCICQYPFTGDGVGPTGCKPIRNTTDLLLPMVDSNQDDCSPSRCLNGAECVKTDSSFECICPLGWTGRLCDEKASVCGGDFAASKGIVVFPSDNSFDELVKLVSSQPTTDGGRHYYCKWSISVAGNMSAKLVLSEFSNKVSSSKKIQMFLSNSSSTASNSHSVLEPPACLEYLDVRELIELDWRLIGRFCTEARASGSLNLTSLPLLSTGRQREVVLLAESNQVRLEYSFSQTRTQFGEPSLSFSLNWSQVEPPCGGELPIVESGSISSPNFPEFYAPGIECRYLIRVPAGQRIRIQFGDLNLLTPQTKTSESSCADSLTLFDGSVGPDRPVLFRHCANNVTLVSKSQGDSIPSRAIVSSSSSAELVLASRLNSAWPLMRPKERRGFYLTYSSEQSEPGCGGLFTKQADTIKSADYQPAALTSSQDNSALALQLATYLDEEHRVDEVPRNKAWSDSGLGLWDRPVPSRSASSIVSRGQRGREDSASNSQPPRDFLYNTRCEYEIRPANQGRNHKISLDWLEMPRDMPIDAHSLSKSRNYRCASSRLTIYDGNRYSSDKNNSDSQNGFMRSFCSGDKYDSSITPLLPITSSAHTMFIVYETSPPSSAFDVPGGFRLRYSTVCQAIYNQLSGRIEAEVNSEISECIYHIMVPPNNTLDIQIEHRTPESISSPDGGCVGQAIFMDGAVGRSKYDLLVAERLLKEYKSSQNSEERGGNATDTRGGPSALYDFLEIEEPAGGNDSDGTTISSPTSGSSTTPVAVKPKKSWFESIYREHSTSLVNTIKEFDMCTLSYLRIDSLWNHMSLLLRLKPQASVSQAQQSVKFQVTATYSAEPTCGGIITDPSEGSFGLALQSEQQQVVGSNNSTPTKRLRHSVFLNRRSNVRGVVATSVEDDCDWIVKAAPNQVIELQFDVTFAAEIKQRYGDWLNWSKLKNNSTGRGGNGGQQSSADRVQDYCYQVFVESIELYEPSLDRYSKLCPMDLIASKPSASHWLTETNVVYIRLLNQRNSESTAPLAPTLTPIPTPTSTPTPTPAPTPSLTPTPSATTTALIWPGRKPLNGSRPILVKYKFRKLNSATQCGGKLLHDSGVIRSPGFPFNYPTRVVCTWHIQAHSRQQIRLNITKFELEPGYTCKFDYFTIYNGPSVDSPLIGKFCDRQLQNKIIVSHSSFLTLKFRSDLALTRSGFEIYYDGAETGCGGRLTTPTGQIDSPNYPRAYGHSSDCEWAIEVSQSNRIELKILELDLNSDSEQQISPSSSPATTASDGGGEIAKCTSSDYLELFDSAGGEFRMKSMGRFCTVPIFKNTTLLSSGNKMLIVFRSRALDYGRGFSLTYGTYCSSIELTGSRGVIESAGYPSSSYLPSMQCEWTIKAPLGSNLTLAITDFAIEIGPHVFDSDFLLKNDILNKNTTCYSDSLTLIPSYATTAAVDTVGKKDPNKAGVLPPYGSRAWNDSLVLCGFYSSLREDQKLIEFNANKATILFKSDRSVHLGGFRIEWQSQGCGSHQRGDTIEPINYHEPIEPPQRPIECLWSIDLSQVGKTVDFQLDSDMRSPESPLPASAAGGGDPCLEASLVIYDGIDDKAPIITKNCDMKKINEQAQTSSPVMLIRFFTNGKHSYGRQFSLSGWPSSRVGGCLTSALDISTPFNRLSGTKSSPNYPDLYDSRQPLHCFGQLSVQTGRLLYRIEELDIPVALTAPGYDDQQGSEQENISNGGGLLSQETCLSSHNYLALRSTSDEIREFFCGQLDPSAPKDVVRSTVVLDQTTILFHTSQAGLRGRWKINYYRLCGSNVTIDLPQEFTSPNYPARPAWPQASMFSAPGEPTTTSHSLDDPTRAENVCIWRLKTKSSLQSDKKLHLNIINFVQSNREGAGRGGGDCLRVYEGIDLSIRQARFNLTDLDLKYRPKIKICKQQDIKSTNLYYVSNGDELIVLVSGEAIVKFRVKPFENFCGGEFHLGQAEFGSPGFPQPYTTDLDCHYFIVGSPGSRISLNFDTFDLPEGTESALSDGTDGDGGDATSNINNKAAATSGDSEAAAARANCDNVDYVEIRQLSISKKMKSIIDSLNSSSLYSLESKLLSLVFLGNKKFAVEWEGNAPTSTQEPNRTTATHVPTAPSPEQRARNQAGESSAMAARRLYELAQMFFLFSGSHSRSRFGSQGISSFLSLEDYYENSKLLGRFCGKKPPKFDEKILHDELLIRFRSHSSLSTNDDFRSPQGDKTTASREMPPRGFLAGYKIQYGGLIKLQTGPTPATTLEQQQKQAETEAAVAAGSDNDEPVFESGLISSPMYPAKVRYNNSIRWQIETRLDHVIQFDLVSLDLGSTKQDCQDTLSILDGLDPSSSIQLSQYCGHLSFKNLQSRSLTSLFTPNTQRASSDLLPVYLAHDPKVRRNLIKSVRTSANLASVVYNNFDSEGSFLLRYKAISKASLLKQQQSADNSTGGPPNVIDDLSAPLDAIIAFKEQDQPPFDVKLNASKTCSGSFKLQLENGKQEAVLTSPNWPNLPPPDTECHWLVYTRDNTNIRLAISPTDTSSLTGDKQLKSYKFYRNPDSCLESVDNFRRAQRSFIVVHDGASRLAPIIGRYCLPAAPIQLQSTGSHLLIRYVHADHTQTISPTDNQRRVEASPAELARSVFKARASVGECGGQYHILWGDFIRDRQNFRTKPTYSSNLDCRYYLFAADQDRVLIISEEMSEFKLSDNPTNENCSVGDYVEIRDLPIQSELQVFSRSSTGRLLGRYCAGRRIEYLESPGSAIIIEFHTDGKNVAKGWELFIMSAIPRVNCPRGYTDLNLDEPIGRFTSPNWPHGFFGKRHCKYHLAAPANQSIQVTFVHLERPQATPAADGKCRDNLRFLADDEAPWMRFRLNTLDHLESPLSGTLLRKQVREVPCRTPTKQQRQVSLVTSGDKLAQMIDSPGYKKLSANDYFKLASLAPPEAFVIKTDSHVLVLDYETKDLLPKEGFVAIYRIIDERRYYCGGEIRATATTGHADNLIESASFGKETSESEPYIQCDWILRRKSHSKDFQDEARLSTGFDVIPTAKLGQFKLGYIVFDTLEIPPATPGAKLVNEQWTTGQVARSNELCGLNRLIITDNYNIQTLFACGNLTAQFKWTILEENVDRVSLRTKNLRLAPPQDQQASDGSVDWQQTSLSSSSSQAAFYRGIKAYYYEKSCVQMERLVGEAVRFRSHAQYPDGPRSYSPGICLWNLHLTGGDYEIWFDSVRFRQPENYLNNTSDSSKRGVAACDVSNPDLDYIEIKSSVESNAAVLARFCIFNQLETKQKSLLLGMKSDISILFVAGIKQLAAGSESFTSDSSNNKEQAPTANTGNNKQRPDMFGFDLQLVRIRNESISEFCRRDMRLNIYWFIKSKGHKYYDSSASELTSSLTSFLYPKNSHCIVDLNVVEGSRINISFTGIFDLESSTDCQNDYIQIDDLVPLNLTTTPAATASTISATTMATYKSTKKPKTNTSSSPDTGIQNQFRIQGPSEKYKVKQLGRWCGKSRPNRYFMSTSNKLRITFHSNERIEGKGFRLEYSAVENSAAGRYGDSNLDDEQ